MPLKFWHSLQFLRPKFWLFKCYQLIIIISLHNETRTWLFATFLFHRDCLIIVSFQYLWYHVSLHISHPTSNWYLFSHWNICALELPWTLPLLIANFFTKVLLLHRKLHNQRVKFTKVESSSLWWHFSDENSTRGDKTCFQQAVCNKVSRSVEQIPRFGNLKEKQFFEQRQTDNFLLEGAELTYFQTSVPQLKNSDIKVWSISALITDCFMPKPLTLLF